MYFYIFRIFLRARRQTKRRGKEGGREREGDERGRKKSGRERGRKKIKVRGRGGKKASTQDDVLVHVGGCP